MQEYKQNTANNDEGKEDKASDIQQNNPLSEIREKGLETEIRNLGYIDQHINENATSWFACSGLEIGLVNIFDSPVETFIRHVVNFDYELVYDPQNDANTALRTFELAVADKEAKVALECERDSPDLRKRRFRTLQSKNSIVTINSAPVDVIDDRVDECTSSITVEGNFACKPYRGSMEFISDCLDCPFSNTEVLAAIKEACENDDYVDGDKILQVNFIGDRTKPVVAITEGLVPIAKSSNVGAITGFVVGFAALFSIFSFYIFKAKKKSGKGKLEDLNVTADLSDDDDNDIIGDERVFHNIIAMPNVNEFPTEIDDSSVSTFKEGIEIEIHDF